MIGLGHKLSKIEGIKHAIYADDITIWATKGSLCQKESYLQEAATCVEEYVGERGLECSTEKSELLRITRGKKSKESLNIRLKGSRYPKANKSGSLECGCNPTSAAPTR